MGGCSVSVVRESSVQVCVRWSDTQHKHTRSGVSACERQSTTCASRRATHTHAHTHTLTRHTIQSPETHPHSTQHITTTQHPPIMARVLSVLLPGLTARREEGASLQACMEFNRAVGHLVSMVVLNFLFVIQAKGGPVWPDWIF